LQGEVENRAVIPEAGGGGAVAAVVGIGVVVGKACVLVGQ